MQGLVEISKQEDDPEQVRGYLNMMQEVLVKQDLFIRDIIDYSRNKRTKIVIQPVSLNQIITDAIAQHQYIEEASGITIGAVIAKDAIKDTATSFIYKQSPERYNDEKQPIYIHTGQLMDVYISQIFIHTYLTVFTRKLTQNIFN